VVHRRPATRAELLPGVQVMLAALRLFMPRRDLDCRTWLRFALIALRRFPGHAWRGVRPSSYGWMPRERHTRARALRSSLLAGCRSLGGEAPRGDPGAGGQSDGASEFLLWGPVSLERCPDYFTGSVAWMRRFACAGPGDVPSPGWVCRSRHRSRNLLARVCSAGTPRGSPRSPSMSPVVTSIEEGSMTTTSSAGACRTCVAASRRRRGEHETPSSSERPRRVHSR
jgi:hypothetical protein